MTFRKYFYTLILTFIVVGVNTSLPLWILLSASVCSLLFYIKNKHSPYVFIIGIIISSSLGSYVKQKQLNGIERLTKKEYNTAIGQFEKRQGKTYFNITFFKEKNKWIRTNCLSNVYDETPSSNSLYIVKGHFNPIKKDFLTNKQMAYSYYSKGVYFNSAIHNYKKIKNRKSNNYETSFLQRIDSSFNDKTSGYLKGILLGNKTQLHNYKEIQTVGLSHLFATSGYHVGLLYLIIIILFKAIPQFKNKNVIEFLISMITIWAYSNLLNFSPSILRAASLFTVLGGLKLLNREFSLIELLSAIGIFMVLFNPLIIYNISFQLSFLAVYSILLFFPILRKFYNRRNRLLVFSLDLLNITFSAQILTLPICILYFNQIPTYSLISNLIVPPIISITIPIALLQLLVNTIIPVKLFAGIVDSLFEFIDHLIKIIYNWPLSSIKPIYSSVELAFLTLATITIIYSIVTRPKKNTFLKVISLNFLLIIAVITSLTQEKKIRYKKLLYVSQSYKKNNFYYIKDQNLYAFESKESSYVKSRLCKKFQVNKVYSEKIKHKKFKINIDDFYIESFNQRLKIEESKKTILDTFNSNYLKWIYTFDQDIGQEVVTN